MADRLLLEIPRGRVRLYRKLELRFPEALSLYHGYRYWITGDNGAGKSSFLRHVLLPALQVLKPSPHLSYIPQDPQALALVLRAGRLLAGESGADLSEQLDHLATLRLHDGVEAGCVWLQDEPESYESVEHACARPAVGDTLILVSHAVRVLSGFEEILFRRLEPEVVEVALRRRDT